MIFGQDALNSISQRLLKRGNSGIKVRVVFPRVSLGQRNVFGEDTVPVYTKNLNVLADVHAICLALVAGGVHYVGFR